MESPSVRRSASTALLVVAALISATALSGQVQGGFHPLGVVDALLPMQCAALFWAWQRVRD